MAATIYCKTKNKTTTTTTTVINNSPQNPLKTEQHPLAQQLKPRKHSDQDLTLPQPTIKILVNSTSMPTSTPINSNPEITLINSNPLALTTHDQDLTSPQHWCPRSWWTLWSHLNVDAHIDFDWWWRWRCLERSAMTIQNATQWEIGNDGSAMTDQDQQFIRERESVREKRKNKLKREEREKRIKKY